MKLFRCQSCGQLLYFENCVCERCRHRLGYLPRLGTLSAVEDAGGGLWRALAAPDATHRFCANAGHDACNWLVEASSDEAFCLACRHNHTIPPLGRAAERALWRRMEEAKHRLFYTLIQLALPLANRQDDPAHGLAFDFLEEQPGTPPVLTGHEDGLITLNLAEADDASRERMRTQMGEPYRTLLGHFRHEIGHHYWDTLVLNGGPLDDCRALFGDERADYAAALKAHYANGAPADWQTRYVSAYASSHPWEDFAETWAHYLHIVDTLEAASSFGLGIHPVLDPGGAMHADLDFDPHKARDVAILIDAWLPLSFAVNSLNRSMGQPDLYPFILTPAVIEKLGFIHGLVHGARG